MYSAAKTLSPSSTFEIDPEDDAKQSSNTDTLGSSAALQVRQLERERRLREIERSFQNVVEEAETTENRIYANVFTETGEVHDDMMIRNMEHTIIESQPKTKAGKLKEKALNKVQRFKKKDSAHDFKVQSKTAAGNFDDFIPQSDFRINTENQYDDVRPQSAVGKLKDKVFNQVKQLTKKESPMHFEMQSRSAAGDFDETPPGDFRKYKNAGMYSSFLAIFTDYSIPISAGILLLGLIVVTTVTFQAIKESAIPATLSEETWDNLKAIRSELIKEGLPRSPLSDYDSPQFTAVTQLAKEVTMGNLYIGSILDRQDVVVETNTTGFPTNFNDAFKEREIILERYILLTAYYMSNNGENQWAKQVNWSANDRSICDGWQGIKCYELIGDNVSVKVVRTIDLQTNDMVGNIPEEFCYLHSLENLYLQNNKLSGKVPKCLGELKKLKHLHLSRNNLKGKMPDSVCDLEGNNGVLEELVSDCGGGFECECCTECL